MRCPACFSAQTNPYAGSFFAGCPGCDVRYVSQEPAHRRARYYEQITDPEELARFKADVSAEYHRLRALRQATTPEESTP